MNLRAFGTTTCLLGFALVLSLSAPANADVLFSNFGAGNTYDTMTFGPVVSGGLTVVAEQFTATMSGVIDSVTFAMGKVMADAIVVMTLRADSGDSQGGVLETFPSASVLTASPVGSVISVTAAGTTALASGTKYWLQAAVTSGNLVNWNLNSLGMTGLHQVSTDPAGPFPAPIPMTTLAVFRLDSALSSTDVPEPSSLALLGLGTVGLAVGAWRRRGRTTASAHNSAA